MQVPQKTWTIPLKLQGPAQLGNNSVGSSLQYNSSHMTPSHISAFNDLVWAVISSEVKIKNIFGITQLNGNTPYQLNDWYIEYDLEMYYISKINLN